MPHVEINCFPGRTEEVKQKCADATRVEGYRVPDDFGVTRALRDGCDRVER